MAGDWEPDWVGKQLNASQTVTSHTVNGTLGCKLQDRCHSSCEYPDTVLHQSHVVKLKQCNTTPNLQTAAEPLAKVASQLQPKQQPITASA
jgi:hypothetical protein